MQTNVEFWGTSYVLSDSTIDTMRWQLLLNVANNPPRIAGEHWINLVRVTSVNDSIVGGRNMPLSREELTALQQAIAEVLARPEPVVSGS